MIHTEISIAPHYKNCRWVEPLKFDPETPPHVIFSHKFSTWKETREFLTGTLKLKTDSQSLEALIDENTENEYVQVEIDLLDQTGRVYTDAILSIEGNEEVK